MQAYLIPIENFAWFISDAYKNGRELARKHVANGGLCGCSIHTKCFLCIEKETKK